MKLIIDPPAGWAYGFPMALPDNYQDPEFVLEDWLMMRGLPESVARGGHHRFWLSGPEPYDYEQLRDACNSIGGGKDLIR